MTLHALATVLLVNGGVADAKCSDVFTSGRFMLVWDKPLVGHCVYELGTEGVFWIHGHHEHDSKEVAALKVAYALGRTA